MHVSVVESNGIACGHKLYVVYVNTLKRPSLGVGGSDNSQIVGQGGIAYTEAAEQRKDNGKGEKLLFYHARPPYFYCIYNIILATKVEIVNMFL